MGWTRLLGPFLVDACSNKVMELNRLRASSYMQKAVQRATVYTV